MIWLGVSIFGVGVLVLAALVVWGVVALVSERAEINDETEEIDDVGRDDGAGVSNGPHDDGRDDVDADRYFEMR